jgi:acetate CoA/acetoacetate CoA-transferase beta subunit
MNSKELIARRVAQEFSDGDFVNLGVGIPSLAASYVPEGINVYFHAENGIVGAGADEPSLPRDPFRTDAGENPVTILPGGAIVDSCTSFGLVRGGHLDATVLGVMQVDEAGSLANWAVPGGKLAGMGGAMDLVAGAKKVIAATEHCSRDGRSKILKECTFPLTAYGVVSVIVTDLAVIEVTPQGLVLKETAPGVSADEVVRKTDAKLIISPDIHEMKLN